MTARVAAGRGVAFSIRRGYRETEVWLPSAVEGMIMECWNDLGGPARWALILVLLLPGAVLAADTPNFVVIFVDDLGYNDLSSYGSPVIDTPNIDRLAEEGIRFTDFYAQNVCGPSRAALLTGSYPVRIGEPGNRKNPHTVLHPREVTIAELLRGRGYATGIVGKWHVAGGGERRHGRGTGPYPTELMPNAQGFDYFFGTPAHNGPTRFAENWKTELYRNEEVLEHSTSMDTLTKRETDEALAFIRKNREQPFFLYLAYNMVHVALGATPEFRGRSKRGLYGDSAMEIDHGVGQVMETLRDLGIDDDTLVVFTSDNGPWVEDNIAEDGGSAYPLRGFKMTTWEGGPRVPGIMRWTGKIRPGQVSGEIASTLDLLPTFASLAGASLPDGLEIDGVDLSEFLLGRRETSGRDSYFYYAWTYLQAVRQENWKLVVPRPENPSWTSWYGRMIDGVETPELYDLDADISEMNNVAGEHPKRVAELLRLYEQARSELGDYDLVGTGARFHDPEPPRPGSRREYAERQRRETDIHTKLSSGEGSVKFRYQDALAHEMDVARRDPSDVIRVGDTYYVWYTNVARQDENYPSGYNGSVWYASSPDGHVWKEQGRCVEPGADDTWDGYGVFTPNILAHDGKYYLYYTAVPEPFTAPAGANRTPTAIGVAISHSPDGPWEKFEANPVLKPALDQPDAFDSMRVDDAALIVREGKIWLYYKGRSKAHGQQGPRMTRMGVVMAEAPTGPFVRYEGNPLHEGHEVLVWPQSFGVGSMATAAGPKQMYYAFDGKQFFARNLLDNAPAAPGVYREDNFQEGLIAPVPEWGIGHARQGGDLYLVRFDFVYGE